MNEQICKKLINEIVVAFKSDPSKALSLMNELEEKLWQKDYKLEIKDIGIVSVGGPTYDSESFWVFVYKNNNNLKGFGNSGNMIWFFSTLLKLRELE